MSVNSITLFAFVNQATWCFFISEFSQIVMDKSNSVIKFRDTKVQLMFENWSVTTKSLAMNKIARKHKNFSPWNSWNENKNITQGTDKPSNQTSASEDTT